MRREFEQQNLSSSQQNILANSIRIARQRIGRNEDFSNNENRQKQNDLHNQTFSFSKPKKQNSAAQAIKVQQVQKQVLHNKIAQLEAFNVTLAKQNTQIKRQANLKNLQIQTLNSQISDYEIQIKECQDQLIVKQKVIKQREVQFKQMQKRQRRKDSEYCDILIQKTQIINESSFTIQNYEQKIADLNRKLENNQKLIVQMIKELEEQKTKHNAIATGSHFNSPLVANRQNQKINKYSKSSKSKQFDNFPVIVDEPEGQKQRQCNIIYKIQSSKKLKSIRESEPKKTNKTSVTKRTDKNLQLINKQIRQKNQQLYNMLRSADRKFKQQQKIKNQYKDRFYSLKNTIDAIIEQITKLPNNLAHKFKCLIVKVKKIQNDNLQCLRSHHNYNRNRLHSKSSRHTSKQNSANSRQKQKKLKMEDLSLSDNDNERKSNSKSKQKSKSKSRQRRSITTYMRSHSGKKDTKAILNQSEQNEIVKAMNKKIRQKRKQICQLYQKINNQSQKQTADRLNIQFEKKFKENIELNAQLDNYKKQKISDNHN